MITVHHLNNSRSQRILWLLEELGLEYTVRRYQRDPVTLLAPPALRAVHPLGKAPVIDDDGVVVAESGAIIEYLVGRYACELAPPPAGTVERLRYTHFLHYAEGSLMPPLLLKLVFDRVASSPAPFFVRPIARAIAHKVLQTFVLPQVRQHLDYLEGELAQRDWFAGDSFSAADIQMSFPLEAAAARAGLDAERYPRLADLLRRIHARSAYARALERGGPFDMVK